MQSVCLPLGEKEKTPPTVSCSLLNHNIKRQAGAWQMNGYPLLDAPNHTLDIVQTGTLHHNRIRTAANLTW